MQWIIQKHDTITYLISSMASFWRHLIYILLTGSDTGDFNNTDETHFYPASQDAIIWEAGTDY